VPLFINEISLADLARRIELRLLKGLIFILTKRKLFGDYFDIGNRGYSRGVRNRLNRR
jgi:hypothetical protein